LQQGIGSVMSAAFSPLDSVNLAVATSTDAISQMLPSFPAATLTSMAIGIPHAHSHPPSLVPPAPPVPLPVIGPIMLGCSVQVLINYKPAARVGDIGFNPTCCGFFPMFEIFTGSSKVFIAGMRAARVLDVTMHCWPPKEWMARGAIAALVMAAKVAMMAMFAAGVAAQVAGIIGDAWEAMETDNSAMVQAEALSAGMMAAQMAADAVAMAVGAMMGKDPCIGSPMGLITIGSPNVLIGGFPMPSGLQIAGRILAGAKGRRRKGGAEGLESCPI
jgi:uncharacterized Zn-binding protein involved in type VI secretion